MSKYEDFTKQIEQILRRLLVTDKYDSVSNFITLHEAYEKSEKSLYDTYRSYNPPVRSYKHTCVGLGFELIRRWGCLEASYPNLRECMGLLSCEEDLKRSCTYVRCGSGPYELCGVEKEHVVAGISIDLEGRAGMLIADPGYHMPRVHTVMADGGYPSTRWSSQSLGIDAINEYFYRYNKVNRDYIEWHSFSNRGTTTKHKVSLIYQARPFIEAVNVTERRNLVYNCRSLIRRNQKGRLMAGIFFKVLPKYSDSVLTLFHLESGRRKVMNVKFSVFEDPKSVDASVIEYIERVSRYMRYSSGRLLRVVKKLRKAVANEAFTSQLLELNHEVVLLSQAQRQHGLPEGLPTPIRSNSPAAAEDSTTE